MWYHVTVSAASVGGNPYVNFSIAASSEYPVKAINVVLIKFCRRRRAVATSFLLVAALLVALVLVPEGGCTPVVVLGARRKRYDQMVSHGRGMTRPAGRVNIENATSVEKSLSQMCTPPSQLMLPRWVVVVLVC